MSIVPSYEGKRVLITGTTGFLGKVLLQKFLYSLSSVEKIYVLIRAKQGSNLHERFKKQIISSACFDRLRQVHKGKFDQFIFTKVQPIQGDLLKDELGLSKEIQDQLSEHCQVVINCAASIDFNARIDNAIDSNIRGTLRMLELSRKMKKLEIFTHISTCYVNCDQYGLIKEEIYEKDTEPEEEFRQLQSMPLNQLIANTHKLLGNFPNTYTYTKNLCERLMKRRQNGVPVCIVRPAIINNSYMEPCPGWIDSIAAAAALFLFVGLGIVKGIRGDPKSIGDIIPVDVVVNLIIVASAYNFRQPKMAIYNTGSSDRNPITWGEVKIEVQNYWNTNVSESRLSKSNLIISMDEWKLKSRMLQRHIPIEIYQRLSLFLGKKHQKVSQKMAKTIRRGDEIAKIFQFFVLHEWIYESRNFLKLLNWLSVEQRKTFIIDVAEIDMKKYIQLNNYGIQKFILKQNAEAPTNKNSNLLKMHEEKNYFADLKWALKTDMPIRPINQIKSKILSSTRVLKAIEYEVERRCEKEKISPDKMKNEVKKQALQLIDKLVAEAKIPVLRTMAWSLHKAFKNIYQKININTNMLEEIRQIEKRSEFPIVLLPTHRSYLDFLVVSYIFFVYNLRLPNFVADEAILQANVLPFIVRSCGSFFFQKKSYQDSVLYRIIFDKYLELLLRQGNTIQFFIEGTRSKTGKILAPRFEILSVVLDTIIYGKVSDVCLIPMTVNYEKVLEGDTFPNELLGEDVLAESFARFIKALPQLRISHGRVYIEICKPIMAKALIDDVRRQSKGLSGNEFRKKVVKIVGKQIIRSMTNGIVIMSTAIVSSVLLMYRKGISEDDLIKMVNELVKYILKKGHKVGGVNQNSSAVAVRNAIGYLSGITTKTKKNIFELTISAGGEFQKILMLSYYRNTMTHAFLPQAFVGCAIAAFGEQLSLRQGVPLQRIHEQSRFLMALLREEYFLDYSLQNYDDFMRIISVMQDNLVVEIIEGNKVIIAPSGARMIAFYCSLLKSQIECYWACLVYILTISRSEDHRYETASLSKFYDTIQWFTESLYDEKVIEDYEACSLEIIKNAFDKYQKDKLVRLVPGGKKKESMVEVLVSTEHLEGIENKIKFFRKSVFNSFISPTEVAKQSLRQLATPKL